VNTGENNEFCEEIDGGIEFTMDMDIPDDSSSDEDTVIDLDDI
jgi:hypothetical protein